MPRSLRLKLLVRSTFYWLFKRFLFIRTNSEYFSKLDNV